MKPSSVFWNRAPLSGVRVPSSAGDRLRLARRELALLRGGRDLREVLELCAELDGGGRVRHCGAGLIREPALRRAGTISLPGVGLIDTAHRQRLERDREAFHVGGGAHDPLRLPARIQISIEGGDDRREIIVDPVELFEHRRRSHTPTMTGGSDNKTAKTQ
ncbi:MAG TPA: hypothetical protein VGI86_03830 [Acidimicrobiia bacterium]